jgi:hypothetical protein
MSLNTELVCLFGHKTIQASKQLTALKVVLEASRVAAASQDLLAMAGQPAKQQTIVKALPRATRLALCRWLHEAVRLEKINE